MRFNMEILNKIAKKANQTYKYTTERTNKLTKEVKLKSMINQDKEKINEIYEKIGKLIYENHIRENENNEILEEVQELCKKIDAYCKEIELNRVELLKLKDLKQCPKCNFEIGLDYHFCPNCGEKQENERNEIKNESCE